MSKVLPPLPPASPPEGEKVFLVKCFEQPRFSPWGRCPKDRGVFTPGTNIQCCASFIFQIKLLMLYLLLSSMLCKQERLR